MDLIDRRQAIDMLCSKCTVDKPETCSTIQKGDNWCEEVYTLQRVPPAQPEQKWIPCSERLPETDEFVLASLSGRYKNIRFEHACEIADYADNEWFINAYPHMTAEIANDLIEAWMPLPEPYMKGVTTT